MYKIWISKCFHLKINYLHILWLENCFENLVKCKNGYTFAPGEMAEWSIAAVLKTVELRGSGGSNPSLSAKKWCRADDLNKSSVLFLCLCLCASPRHSTKQNRHGRLLCILGRAWHCLLKVGVARIELCLLLGLQPPLIWYPREDEPKARPSNPSLSAKNKRSKKVSKIRHLLFLDSMAQIYLQT